MPLPAFAQSNDAKYCAELVEKYDKYVSEGAEKGRVAVASRGRDRERQAPFEPGIVHTGDGKGTEERQGRLAATQLSRWGGGTEPVRAEAGRMNRRAVLYALLSAMLFGFSTPAAKALLGSTDPGISPASSTAAPVWAWRSFAG